MTEFLRQAGTDPAVAAIRMTLYRTGISSTVVDLLEEAARRGKEVTAVVELKARFDEEANINLAERLEAVGAQVVYGVMGLKTHGKATQVLRRELVDGRPALVPYVHLGTGNYHSTTTRLYTDFGMLTANPEICADVDKVFMHLTSLTKVERLKHLWMAPFTLHRNLLKALAGEVAAATAGKPAHVIAKMNSLTDETTINALYAASQAGVRIDLIVRGACALRPGVKGLSENIKVRSIVGRFLEHHRIYYFENGGDAARVPVERRLDGTQPVPPHRDRLAGARSEAREARPGRRAEAVPRGHDGSVDTRRRWPVPRAAAAKAGR